MNNNEIVELETQAISLYEITPARLSSTVR